MNISPSIPRAEDERFDGVFVLRTNTKMSTLYRSRCAIAT
jgi:hypothetical protein